MSGAIYKGTIKDASFLCSFEGFIPRKDELITIGNETYIVNKIQYDYNEDTVRVFVDVYDWE